MDWLDGIPGRFPHTDYEVHVPYGHIERWLENMSDPPGLNLDPEYQRAHVWTEEQQTAFLEYSLRGGQSGQVLYWSSPGEQLWRDTVELVDGKQRLEAARRFMAGELPVFGGHYLKDPGKIDLLTGFRMRICLLSTRAAVLRWYLYINAGGTPHSPEELNRVKKLLVEEEKKSL